MPSVHPCRFALVYRRPVFVFSLCRHARDKLSQSPIKERMESREKRGERKEGKGKERKEEREDKDGLGGRGGGVERKEQSGKEKVWSVER